MLKSKSPNFAKNPNSFYAQMALDTIVKFQSIPKDHKSCIKQVEYNQMRCGKDSHGSVGCGEGEPNSAFMLLPPSKLGNSSKWQSIFSFGWSSIDAQSSKLHKVIPCSWTHFPITLECLQECASTKILQQDQSFSIYFDQTKKKGEEIGPRPREKKEDFGSKNWENRKSLGERESVSNFGVRKEKENVIGFIISKIIKSFTNFQFSKVKSTCLVTFISITTLFSHQVTSHHMSI